MPWIVKNKKECMHTSRPKLIEDEIHLAGSIWECESCKKQFKVVTKRVERGMQWDPYMTTVVEWKAGDYV